LCPFYVAFFPLPRTIAFITIVIITVQSPSPSSMNDTPQGRHLRFS